ncbi:MAG TPA: peptide-methionine (S)-S-oxide reductase MsrA [Burkholderiales bacterium]|nr:peptide-methionine (S)-S-oxide reductase MsrA [Burkholderiales bacterium]
MSTNRTLATLASAAALAALALASPAPAPAQGKPAARPAATAKATFAGGCFWCMEEAFDPVPGVIATVSGYMGGKLRNPSYEQVSTGRTGHAEVVQVEYDPAKVSYAKLLEVFWRNVDPTQKDGQFCDYGSQYRTAIFYHDEEQRKLAEASKAALAKNKPFAGEIVTEIVKASEFYPAEDYHQDFYLKNPARYKFYKSGCGREARLRQLWGKPGG